MYIVFVAWGWGDPHITTIDGCRYTFNGLGEYVLLRESASNFEFQGRTELAPNSNATIFSAFALRDDNNIVQVITIVYKCVFSFRCVAIYSTIVKKLYIVSGLFVFFQKLPYNKLTLVSLQLNFKIF